MLLSADGQWRSCCCVSGFKVNRMCLPVHWFQKHLQFYPNGWFELLAGSTVSLCLLALAEPFQKIVWIWLWNVCVCFYFRVGYWKGRCGSFWKNPHSSSFHLNSYYTRVGNTFLFQSYQFYLAIRAAGFQSMSKKMRTYNNKQFNWHHHKRTKGGEQTWTPFSRSELTIRSVLSHGFC